MISIAAIVAAMAFWAPLNSGQPVCGGTIDGAYIHVVTRAETDATFNGTQIAGMVMGYTKLPGAGCEIWLSDDLPDDPAIQCQVVTHELGHAVFGFGHSDDPHNVMYREATPAGMPAICAALDTKPQVHLGTALRIARVCRNHGHRRRCFYRQTFSSGETS